MHCSPSVNVSHPTLTEGGLAIPSIAAARVLLANEDIAERATQYMDSLANRKRAQENYHNPTAGKLPQAIFA